MMEENKSFKITPLISNEKEVYKFYEFVLGEGYEVKIFDKRKMHICINTFCQLLEITCFGLLI